MLVILPDFNIFMETRYDGRCSMELRYLEVSSITLGTFEQNSWCGKEL
jgi:hypothetical protein